MPDVYEGWYIGQRVYYYYPTMSQHKFYGTIVELIITAHSYKFTIDFDGFTKPMYYENIMKPGYERILIHPDEDTREPSWEV